MLTFTPLEERVLDAICKAERANMPTLSGVLSTALVTSRDNTGHGFYTEFRTASSVATSGSGTRMIDGPCVRMLEMGDDALMGFILWCSDDGSNTLEGYQLGDSSRDTVDLKTRDLSKLRFESVG